MLGRRTRPRVLIDPDPVVVLFCRLPIMPVTTTLRFAGRTEEALSFYQQTLGAETIFLMRFRDSPDQSHHRPAMDDMIFHATFRIDGTELMASDVGYDVDHGDRSIAFAGFALALSFHDVDRAQQVFDQLAVDGEVQMPLEKSAFTSWYGIVVDRFGISWKINVSD